MEQKYILNEEDVRNLSPEQKNEYNHFLGTVRDSGIVYQAQLQKFDEILQQQYRSDVLFNPNSLERYPEILAKNINSVIDTITQFRNNAINDKGGFEQFGFQKINEGLDVLKKFVETKLQSPHYQNSIGYSDLKSVLPRIDQLKSQISQDMNFYQGYYDEKISAIANYKSKKEAYDRLSLFGKFAARINGKKKELTEAQQKKNYYNSARLSSVTQQPGDIVNPCQYDEYLEKQQLEQSTGGMRR